jgi:hypothetical protein
MDSGSPALSRVRNDGALGHPVILAQASIHFDFKRFKNGFRIACAIARPE